MTFKQCLAAFSDLNRRETRAYTKLMELDSGGGPSGSRGERCQWRLNWWRELDAISVERMRLWAKMRERLDANREEDFD